MKRQLTLTICSVVLLSASGCHFCECTNQAFARLFGGGCRSAPAQQCQMAPSYCYDPCDGGTVVSPGCVGGGAVFAPSAGCGCGTPVLTPSPVPVVTPGPSR
jgi:hypothetical protein